MGGVDAAVNRLEERFDQMQAMLAKLAEREERKERQERMELRGSDQARHSSLSS